MNQIFDDDLNITGNISSGTKNTIKNNTGKIINTTGDKLSTPKIASGTVTKNTSIKLLSGTSIYY
ncbi:MAG: hypothetical protein WCL02_04840 [bacterium]